METPATRRRIMQAVRSKDTGPEMVVRRIAHGMGFRYRLHRADLPGKPDLVFPARRKVVFVHGCFWHGHDCERGARQPKANADYWRTKIQRNRQRDRNSTEELKAKGWKALTLWECELRDTGAVRQRIYKFLGHPGAAKSAS